MRFMQPGNVNQKDVKAPSVFISMFDRNRVAGSIAICLGIVILVALVIENRWDDHDSFKPSKALLGSIAFIASGIWYLWKGAKAEPWHERTGRSLTTLSGKPNSTIHKRINMDSLAEEELHKSIDFKNKCERIENELREAAIDRK